MSRIMNHGIKKASIVPLTREMLLEIHI